MGTQLEHSLEDKLEFKKPRQFQVLLLNDDYTSMEFVIKVLVEVFHKSTDVAYKIMLDVHKNQSGLCGVYTFDIAETKVLQVEKMAKSEGFPLKAVMQEI